MANTSFKVEPDDYFAWKDGKLIQEAFPYLSAGQRELLISNTCEKCWEKLFGDGEYDEPACEVVINDANRDAIEAAYIDKRTMRADLDELQEYFASGLEATCHDDTHAELQARIVNELGQEWLNDALQKEVDS
jgi:hypothetical protein